MSLRQNNKLKEDADEYLRKHHIIELFEDLCTAICFKQPEDVEAFIVEQLKLKKTHGLKTGIFGEGEIQNIFALFDLKREGFISQAQCKEALRSLASSEYQYVAIDDKDIPEKVDSHSFAKLCEQVLGSRSQKGKEEKACARELTLFFSLLQILDV
eukprot:TRINITY_DN8836_c0_g1_i5.p1 TRINITY_DN8836_c0_g1~~TRINITY_DN8836_c0_g1_i5.p1  ORF type:complete len:156 (+),score=32.87 TRINITY_DN8836_c0_g1_i5:162-629(+)